MLFSSLFVSNTGLQSASAYLDVTSNNVANADTNGYKTSLVNFQDLLYTGPPAGTAANGLTDPQGTQLGSGAALSSTTGRFTQGTLIQSGQQFDLAITGNGFFQVTLPDGTAAFTRDGHFTTNANGQLVTADGNILSPGVTVPAGTSAVSIAPDGTAVATTAAGPVTLGTITLTNFQNPAGLSRIGDTLFAPTGAAGVPTASAPGTGGLGTLTQGALEGSNVDLSTELVNLLIAQRAFQFNSQALVAETNTIDDTTALIT